MPERLPDINLLPKYERQNDRFFYLYMSFVIITMLAFILLGVFYVSTKVKLASAESEFEQLSTDEEILLAELEQLEQGKRPTLGEAATFVEQQTIETSRLITQLEHLLPMNSYLSNYEYGTQVTSISAQFKTLNTVANYTTSLTESNYINDTQVNNIGAVYAQDESDDISYYDARFTLNVNKPKLKKESKKNE